MVLDLEERGLFKGIDLLQIPKRVSFGQLNYLYESWISSPLWVKIKRGARTIQSLVNGQTTLCLMDVALQKFYMINVML